MKQVTSRELENLIQSESKTVFCDFWASWCAPCRMLAPVFEEMAGKYDGQAVFVKMDIDEDDSQDSAMKYGVSSIPNVIAFKNGKPVANNVGFVPGAVLENFVKQNL
jgi:thioredoxin 1